jgi:hypothetical protein
MRMLPALLLCLCLIAPYSVVAEEVDTRAEIESLKKRIQELEDQQANNAKLDQPAARAPARVSPFIRGPRGGCYTLSSSGRKRYVDRNLCD